MEGDASSSPVFHLQPCPLPYPYCHSHPHARPHPRPRLSPGGDGDGEDAEGEASGASRGRLTETSALKPGQELFAEDPFILEVKPRPLQPYQLHPHAHPPSPLPHQPHPHRTQVRAAHKAQQKVNIDFLRGHIAPTTAAADGSLDTAGSGAVSCHTAHGATIHASHHAPTLYPNLPRRNPPPQPSSPLSGSRAPPR